MKKSLFYASFLIVSVSIQVTSQASEWGSYLFCVNDNDPADWAPGPKNLKGVLGFENQGSSGSTQGSWIDGVAKLNKYAHSVLDVSYVYKNFDEAQKFCTALKNSCTEKWGTNYAHVGASGASIPYSVWGYVSVNYKDTDGSIKNSVCPNWNYKEFPNDGGPAY